MVGVDADGYGHSLARTYTLTTHSLHNHPQSAAPWWDLKWPHPKQGNSQPTRHTHNPLLHCVDAPWCLQPSTAVRDQTIFPSLSGTARRDSNIQILQNTKEEVTGREPSLGGGSNQELLNFRFRLVGYLLNNKNKTIHYYIPHVFGFLP